MMWNIRMIIIPIIVFSIVMGIYTVYQGKNNNIIESESPEVLVVVDNDKNNTLGTLNQTESAGGVGKISGVLKGPVVVNITELP